MIGGGCVGSASASCAGHGRHGIQATRRKRVTPANTLDPQIHAGTGAMYLDGFHRVHGTGRRESAGLADPGAQEITVETDGPDQQAPQRRRSMRKVAAPALRSLTLGILFRHEFHHVPHLCRASLRCPRPADGVRGVLVGLRSDLQAGFPSEVPDLPIGPRAANARPSPDGSCA